MMHTASADDRSDSPHGGSIEVSAYVVGWEFESLYAAKYSDMVRLAYFLTGSMAQAEEATQDSFVRLYERWSKVDNHPAYLRTSVVNRCRSWHRSRFAALRRESRLDDRHNRPDDHHDRPDEINDALAKLPRRRREVIVLRYYEGLALADIASVLGISEGTVKSTLHHGLNELKGALHE
jgi:RNA polymerase sigma-70 factor (sigma-E family)